MTFTNLKSHFAVILCYKFICVLENSLKVHHYLHAMTNETSHKKKSLCKKSMMLVANIMKLSTISLASMSLGTNFKQPPIDCVPATAEVPSVNASMVPEFPRSQRSQEPESDPKQYSYLIEPEKDNSSYVICERDIDEKAAEYIKRIHERNRNDSNTAAFSSISLLL